ncbi:GNAT family N-acetyltransferase [Kordiimonas sp. SCSIO 12610]|uniref:GNAT family N-acetyltransferase n=1 Tax=Kordiimonas sp. SCSIO 12610 TaxID=2829597 RepID=UPI00210BE6A0|nr:GNAT family N-acetyltransferase [Kordiimonas sp. SCSIO 12610]UTW56675.1 GNAT family N-acetyltransferase [Kordiimonas sp. SCSIO 12610]
MATKPSHIKLETKRLIIREHSFDDIDAVEAYSTQEKFWRYLQVGELKEGAGRSYIERVVAEQSARPRTEFNLALVLKDTGQVIGNVRLGVTDLDHGECILGYALAVDQWGHGYASEGVRGILDFAFNTLMMHRVYAMVDSENTASIHVLEKAGFTREGLLRENKRVGNTENTRTSSYVYGLLAHEYRTISCHTVA